MPIYALGKRVPDIHPDAWIAPTAVVLGSVTIGKNASVWWGAVVRGDTEQITIGDETNIQDGAVLHVDPGVPLTLGRGCTVGHQAMIHGSTIGDHCLIGIQAVVLNQTTIGDESVIGANALLTERSEIPARSLVVGSPGKVKRTLDDRAARGLHMSAAGYVAKCRTYRDSLRLLP